MPNKWILASLALSGTLAAHAQDLVLNEGQYYTDESQTVPYTGRYTEFYDDGMLKMELYLKDGRPEGTYVVYYPDGKIAEVRAYYQGTFHGEWRTYNEQGRLTGLATYRDGRKDGPWRIWDDQGVLRCEMFYAAGRKSGLWRTWNEQGELLTESRYADGDPAPETVKKGTRKADETKAERDTSRQRLPGIRRRPQE